MLTIRLQRIGKKHQPGYRIVVAENRSKLGGPPVEQIGSYDPFSKKAVVEKERALHWLRVGAQASPSVHNMFVKNGVVSGAKVAIKIRKPKADEVAGEAPVTAPAPAAVAEKPATEEPKNAAQKEPQAEAQSAG